MQGDSDPPSQAERKLQQLKKFDSEGEYYAITIGMNRDMSMFISTQTSWVGFSERNSRWEVREASLVNPVQMSETWDLIGEGWIGVHSPEELAVFVRIGGNALMYRDIAEQYFSDTIAPSECVHDGPVNRYNYGFIDMARTPDAAIKERFARGATRMRILKRDDFRCRICGRRPSDYLDLELHVHHVLPWRYGGVTIDGNLITLCKTCHGGLDPDFEPKLRELAFLPGRANSIDEGCKEFRAEIFRYRRRIRDILRKEIDTGGGHGLENA
jgi:hypothetical protein